jgi:REP element-mobilizing transposase RayT
MTTRKPKQLDLRFPTWGGRREGAGRKPKGEKKGASHKPRPLLQRRFPVHVTVRMRHHVYNLRAQRCFRPIAAAIAAARACSGMRVNHYAVLGNHIHLIVEAEGTVDLARGMQSLSIRIARRLNAVMGRAGAVFADRYFAHILKTPAEVRHAVRYVLRNAQRHYGVAGADPFSSAAHPQTVAAPRTWLLRDRR